jgi:hypothetical protein
MSYLSVLVGDIKSILLQHFWLDDIITFVQKLEPFRCLQNDNTFWKATYETHLKTDLDGVIEKKSPTMPIPKKRKCEDNNHDYRDICTDILREINDNKYVWPFNGNILDCVVYYRYYNAVPFIVDSTNKLGERFAVQLNDVVIYHEDVKLKDIPLERLIKDNNFKLVKYLFDRKLIAGYIPELFIDFVIQYCHWNLGLFKYFTEHYCTLNMTELLLYTIKRLNNMVKYHGFLRPMWPAETEVLRFLIKNGADSTVVPPDYHHLMNRVNVPQ